ncbi:MAG TPA: TylF/MycF/NovP-related O-methyltransferase [Verrucomicrobiae bacterium]|nr:TylF/MycF/NovP-related O-methyltransferase [Verrucomicrobiae bacterium]
MLLKKIAAPAKGFFFNTFGRYLVWLFSSPYTLTLKRCDKKDIVPVIQTARVNHPEAALYILSDTDIPTFPNTKRINSVDDLKYVSTPAAVVLACNSDELAFAAVKYIQAHSGIFYYGANRVVPAARYFHRNEIGRKILIESHKARLGKFDLPDFENIIQALEITRRNEGDYVEIGVFKGDSAYAALDYMDRANIQKRAYLFDTFCGFDYEGAETSADRTWYKTHGDASMDAVRKLLSRFKTSHEVIKANIITDPLPDSIKKIVACNIDVDMYEAVAAALAKVAPLMVEGGIIIVEDQGHTPLLIGAYVAVREFLESSAGRFFVPIQMMSGQMFLIRTRGGGN